MPLVGQPVPHGHPGVGGECLDDVLPEAAVGDPVVDAAEHSSGVLDRLLVPDVGAGGAQVGDVGAVVVGCDLERDPCAGGGLLED